MSKSLWRTLEGRVRHLVERQRRGDVSDAGEVEVYRRLERVERWLKAIERAQLRTAHLAANILIEENRNRLVVRDLEEVEFRVCSQWGEDGIIQFLISAIEIPHQVFIEFGVQSYQEANTRFLLEHDNWKGLVMDGSADAIAEIRRSDFFWRHDLTARTAFVTRENIDSLIDAFTTEPDIGLLSIDVDGNDYWIWDAIRVIRPRIVICEYNSVFGNTVPVTVPYDPAFDRRQAHHSHLYFGASLPALRLLAEHRGYGFAGCNSAGNNAFFVRADLWSKLELRIREKRYVCSLFRESRDREGRLSFVAGDDRLREISHLPVIDLRHGSEVALREVISISPEPTGQR